jgi:hypothetical protein
MTMICLLFAVTLIIECILFYGYNNIKFTFQYLFLIVRGLFGNLIFEVKIRYWYLKQRWKK